MISPEAKVHPLAHTDDTVSIGKRTRVWQFSSVIRGTILGENCNVASGTTLDGPVFGDDCIICHNIAMGPGFKVGNRVFIAPGVTFANDAWPKAMKDGWDAAEFSRTADGDKWAVIVEDGVSIGANAVILPGVRIGAGAMIAAGSIVRCDVPADHLYLGTGQIRPIVGTPPRMRFARV